MTGRIRINVQPNGFRVARMLPTRASGTVH